MASTECRRLEPQPLMVAKECWPPSREAGLTDERVKTTAEVLSGILTVKAHCWEAALTNKLAAVRAREHASILRSHL